MYPLYWTPIKEGTFCVIRLNLRFYNLFWGAKVTVQMRVLSAPTFFNKKIGICTQILYN